MKLLRFLPLLLMMTVFFTSCEKELSFESGEATGTLKDDGTGDCLPVQINGTYTKDIVLDATNSVDIQADIDQTGSYAIKSDTLNGYSFSAIGNAAVSGLTTIHLVGSGKPLAGGVNVFTVEFNNTTCKINVVVNGAAAPTATYTLGTTGTACTGAVLAGTYMSGLTMTSSNTATVNVNVTVAGSYSINTAAVNGVTFSGAGTFSGTGAQTITLTASGTPAASGLFSYPLTAGSSTCSFDVTYAAAAPPGAFTFACSTTPVQAGDYNYGEPLDPSANTVTISINVTALGSYNITAPGNPADGTTFTASGVFTALGAQTVVLRGTGTSTTQALSSHTVSSPQGTGTCSFALYWQFMNLSINGVLPARNFSFSAGTNLDVNASGSGYDILTMYGYGSAVATDPEAVGVSIGLPTPAASFPTGVYNCNSLPAKYADALYTDPSNNDFVMFPMATPQIPGITITITFSSSTIIEGNFAGQVKDGNGTGTNSKTISGSFGLRR